MPFLRILLKMFPLRGGVISKEVALAGSEGDRGVPPSRVVKF